MNTILTSGDEIDAYAIDIVNIDVKPIITDSSFNEEKMENVSYKINLSSSSLATSSDDFFDFKLHNFYIQSNSPISMSENNSDSDEEEQKSIEYNENIKEQYFHKEQSLRRRHEYEDIEKELNNDYEKDNYKYSRQLDMLILFIKGQKNIYFQSKNITQAKLFLFMIPILLITIAVTIFAPIIEDYKWSGGVISGLNFLVTSLVSIMNFMKLESKTECYNQIASQYDKIETSLELISSKLFFIKTEEEKKEMVLSKILETEVRLNEIKDINPVIIPNEIKIVFPIISHTNVFSLIKKIENEKRDLIFQLMHTKNEIHYILNKWKRSRGDISSIDRNREKNRLFYLYEIKTKIKDDIIKCSQIFQKLEADFLSEIVYTEKINPFRILFCSCFVSKPTDPLYISLHTSV